MAIAAVLWCLVIARCRSERFDPIIEHSKIPEHEKRI